jgi:archaetidylinositol phosphate synthase
MIEEKFAGQGKVGASFLSPLERKWSSYVIPKIPLWLETYHLTMLTLVWSVLILLFSYFATKHINWLWMVSLMVVFHYITDHLDGKVGKYRNTGLVRWGYYMDHLLDYFFMCSVLLGYAMLCTEKGRYNMLFLLAVFAGYMVNSFLTVAALGQFKVDLVKFGPTEFRLAIVIINTLLIFGGTKKMNRPLIYVAGGGLIGLCILVYQTHKKIWQLDMEEKSREGERD